MDSHVEPISTILTNINNYMKIFDTEDAKSIRKILMRYRQYIINYANTIGDWGWQSFAEFSAPDNPLLFDLQFRIMVLVEDPYLYNIYETYANIHDIDGQYFTNYNNCVDAYNHLLNEKRKKKIIKKSSWLDTWEDIILD